MKQVTVNIYCDDCGKVVFEDDIKYFISTEGPFKGGKDICYNCIAERIIYSCFKNKIGRKCKQCGGKGVEKEFYGYNNDFNWVDCKNCSGAGYTKLK